MILNINSDALVVHTNRLEKMHRSALPSAIRNTLNDAAYDVKTKTMPEKAKVFKKRQPNFFKANSKFEKAVGFNVSTMKSTVGFYENKLANQSTNYAVKDLEQQEEGGKIDKKTFIAQKGARKNNRQVLQQFNRQSLRGAKFITAKGKGTLKQQYIRAAIYAAEHFGSNAYVLGGRGAKGFKTLSKINQVRLSGRYTKGKYNLEISRTPIYSVKKGNVTNVKATNFMKRASLESGAKMNEFYIKQAQKQFEKYNK